MHIIPYEDDENSRDYLDKYDEKTGKWVCELGCGFRDLHSTNDVLEEDVATINKYYRRMGAGDTARESFAVAWTYHYDSDIFSCSYEIAEYMHSKRRIARFRVERVDMKELEKIQKALRVWHATGEMVIDGIFIEFGEWE